MWPESYHPPEWSLPPSRPFSLQTPVETRFSASWSDLQLDSQHPEEIGWWLSVQKIHQVTCAEMSNCQTLCTTSNSAQCDTLSIVARKYQPSKVQLFCAKKLPSFKKQSNPQKWVANHPCRPRCYPRLAHVHVNHLSGRAARRNHLRKHQGQCQALSWAVVSWFCRVYWLIGILIVHYGWRIKIISMKSGRAISIKRTGWIGHQSLTPGLSDVWAKNHLKYRIVDFHDKRVSCI